MLKDDLQQHWLELENLETASTGPVEKIMGYFFKYPIIYGEEKEALKVSYKFIGTDTKLSPRHTDKWKSKLQT